MKLAQKGVALPFANVGGPNGAIVAHVFVNDSRSPICHPAQPGAPGELTPMQNGFHWCQACWRRLVRATWSLTSCAGKLLWCVTVHSAERCDSVVERLRAGVAAALLDRPDTWGYAASELEAFERVAAAVSSIVATDAVVEICRVGEAEALKIAREQRAEARAKVVSDDTGAQLTEYVYRHFKKYPSWFSTDFVWETERCEVLRKTAKRLFVENRLLTYKTASGATVLKTYALDRVALERGKHRYGWTLDPNPPRDSSGKIGVPGWADVLGLSMPCTLAEAKRAFRTKAKEAHPDHGGSPEAFQRVKAAFDAAASQLGGVQ